MCCFSVWTGDVLTARSTVTSHSISGVTQIIVHFPARLLDKFKEGGRHSSPPCTLDLFPPLSPRLKFVLFPIYVVSSFIRGGASSGCARTVLLGRFPRACRSSKVYRQGQRRSRDVSSNGEVSLRKLKDRRLPGYPAPYMLCKESAEYNTRRNRLGRPQACTPCHNATRNTISLYSIDEAGTYDYHHFPCI